MTCAGEQRRISHTPADVGGPAPSLFGAEAARDALCRRADGYVARATVMMRRARLLVLDDRAERIDLLTARRVALCEHFGRYQQFKHGSIFDPVVRHGRASSRIVARTMKLDCMALGERFGGYHARWLGMRRADWPHYRKDMLATVDMLSVHLRDELRAMRQLLTIADFYDV